MTCRIARFNLFMQPVTPQPLTRLPHHTAMLPRVALQPHAAIGISPCSPYRTAAQHLASSAC